MPIRPGQGGSTVEAGFTETQQGFKHAPVAPAVREASRHHTPERVYDGITRQIRLTNRAEKGAMKGKPFFATVDSATYPDGADGMDPSTWLQPGESMIVARDVALVICGDVFSPNNIKLDRDRIIKKYGDWLYQHREDGMIVGRNIPMKAAGPPRDFPDLIVEQIDGRGRVVGPAISIFDVYIGEQRYAPEIILA